VFDPCSEYRKNISKTEIVMSLFGELFLTKLIKREEF
jgi:hypothetical protein